MSANEDQKAGNMVYQTAEPLPGTSREPSKPKHRRALLIVAASLLLTTSLAQAAPAGGSNRPFRVVDKRGNLVGYTVTDNMVAREINGLWVTFYVHPADPDGIFNSDAIYLHYLTTDCSGTPYVTHYSTFSEGTRVGSKLYYPTDQQQLNPLSLRVAHGDGALDACQAASNISGVYGAATTVDVSSFGLELPFTATQ
jgi:hypothetical protein